MHVLAATCARLGRAFVVPLRLLFAAADRPRHDVLAGAVAVLLVGMAFRDAFKFGSDWVQWDWMFHSGLLTSLCFLALSLRAESMYDEVVLKLRRHAVLHGRASDFAALDARFRERKPILAVRGGRLFVSVQVFALVTALVVYYASDAVDVRVGNLADFLIFEFPPDDDYPDGSWRSFGWVDLGLFVLCAFLAYLAGLRFGTLWAGGQLPWMVREVGIELVPVPGHPDGAGGFRPWGDLYLLQAAVIAIPLAWLALWWVLAGYYGSPDQHGKFELHYDQWRIGFVALWAAAAVFMNYAFVGPTRAIHASMAGARRRRIEADLAAISARQLELQARLATATDAHERTALGVELRRGAEYLKHVEDLPVWPFTYQLTVRYAVLNAFLVLGPVVLQNTTLSEESVSLLTLLLQLVQNVFGD